MLPYPNISPDIIRIGPLRIRWYGLMYILGFLAAYVLIQRQQRSRELGLVGERTQDLMFHLVIGLVAGARIGYLMFYQDFGWGYYLQNPLEIIAVWHGGMSFHGGLAGCMLAGIWFCRRHQMPYLAVADSVIVTAPIGLGLGRLGNFINGELFGRVADVPWAMVFPEGGPLPRHPSQLYEAMLEGLVLFALLWWLRKRAWPDGMMLAFFLLLYGVFRFSLEYLREPDPQLGLVWHSLTMGQLLCALMALAGLVLGLAIIKYNAAKAHAASRQRS